MLTIHFRPLHLFPSVSIKCKCQLWCQHERENETPSQKDRPQERCLVMLFSMEWPRYYCRKHTGGQVLPCLYLISPSRKLIWIWIGGSILLFFQFFFLLYPPLAGCHRIAAWDFVFYLGVSLNFPLIRATIASFPFRGLGSGPTNKKSPGNTPNH